MHSRFWQAIAGWLFQDLRSDWHRGFGRCRCAVHIQRRRIGVQFWCWAYCVRLAVLPGYSYRLHWGRCSTAVSWFSERAIVARHSSAFFLAAVSYVCRFFGNERYVVWMRRDACWGRMLGRSPKTGRWDGMWIHNVECCAGRSLLHPHCVCVTRISISDSITWRPDSWYYFVHAD